MIPRTLAQIAAITGGRIAGIATEDAERLVIDGPVVTDSREAGAGGLYIARVGASADGHDFIPAAAQGGAAAALVTRDLGPLPRVVVPDEQAAFVALARSLIDASPGLRVIGITGSSGKTSTKDLLGQVLATAGETVAPVGSYNSEVGVPLTVCRITPTTRYLVVEMGARGAGHIRYLTQIAPPQTGIVLNVGSAHVGEFGSREAIGIAKGELIAALPADGLAILNADDVIVSAMAQRTTARVVRVGEHPDADLRAREITLDATGRAQFLLDGPFVKHRGGGDIRVRLAVAGRHQVGNALAVIVAATEAGMPLPAVVAALADAGPVSRYRMEVGPGPEGITIVNDAYNANPESMTAALDALASMGQGEVHGQGQDQAQQRRRVAILGPMLELGAEAEAAHRAVGEYAVRSGVDVLLVVGDEAREIGTGASAAHDGAVQVRYAPDVESAYSEAAALLRAGDLVLVKSSNGAGLRFLGDRLREMPALEGGS